jgi:cysteine desulfurase
VVFTSGATESNNLAILGLAPFAHQTGKRHIVSTRIEHRAVLEPLAELQRHGFAVTLVSPGADGRIAASDILGAVRDDTLLVSVMHVNNETGVVQPIAAIAEQLGDRAVLLHVDAAQGFGKDIQPLRHPRIDLISVSGHKIHGPKGVGALIARRRRGELPPLSPLHHGGGQEFGLRPGTLAVHLIAGLGKAAELAVAEIDVRREACRRLRVPILRWLVTLDATIHGAPEHTLPHVVNASIPGLAGDQVIEAVDGVLAVSDGAACTSVCSTASHVLAAMGVPEPHLTGAFRLSWSHMTDATELESALTRAAQRLAEVRG